MLPLYKAPDNKDILTMTDSAREQERIRLAHKINDSLEATGTALVSDIGRYELLLKLKPAKPQYSPAAFNELLNTTARAAKERYTASKEIQAQYPHFSEYLKKQCEPIRKKPKDFFTF